ncbi:hypothetical protein [Thermobifida alba]|uniref:hypothetical protein n=1 Tax=Thermobifida alba TaxID=53522 RepID=UPI0031E84781
MSFGGRVVERVRWDLVSSTNLGDGVVLAEVPLLVASVSTDPVAGGAVASQVPAPLFGVVSGTLVDRWPCRRLVVVTWGRAGGWRCSRWPPVR